MIFHKEMVEAILSGKKTETRRLVKPYQESIDLLNKKTVIIRGRKRKDSFKIKWQVGRDYAVSLGRGKKGLTYCKKCKGIVNEHNVNAFDCKCMWSFELNIPSWKPLRIEITGLKKQKLLGITEVEAKKEGFKDKHEFISYFLKIVKLTDLFKLKNPEVWVISFKVKK